MFFPSFFFLSKSFFTKFWLEVTNEVDKLCGKFSANVATNETSGDEASCHLKASQVFQRVSAWEHKKKIGDTLYFIRFWSVSNGRLPSTFSLEDRWVNLLTVMWIVGNNYIGFCNSEIYLEYTSATRLWRPYLFATHATSSWPSSSCEAQEVRIKFFDFVKRFTAILLTFHRKP